MREVFAHEAIVRMGPEEDVRAPGAAITVRLCGHWEHEPPCPLAPHNTACNRIGAGRVRVRTVFLTEPASENEVRTRIRAALGAGRLPGPGAGSARWTLEQSASSAVREDELAAGLRLGGRSATPPTAPA